MRLAPRYRHEQRQRGPFDEGPGAVGPGSVRRGEGHPLYPLLGADEDVAALVEVQNRNDRGDRVGALEAQRPSDVLAMHDCLRAVESLGPGGWVAAPATAWKAARVAAGPPRDSSAMPFCAKRLKLKPEAISAAKKVGGVSFAVFTWWAST